MRDDATQSALAEITLALAMCFFSIAIVSLVSMAVPAATANAHERRASSPPPKVTLASAVGDQDKAPMPSDMTLVVHDGTSFRDAELNALNTDSLDPETPVLLAVHPRWGLKPRPHSAPGLLRTAWL